jgi:hypothetical protein
MFALFFIEPIIKNQYLSFDSDHKKEKERKEKKSNVLNRSGADK